MFIQIPKKIPTAVINEKLKSLGYAHCRRVDDFCEVEDAVPVGLIFDLALEYDYVLGRTELGSLKLCDRPPNSKLPDRLTPAEIKSLRKKVAPVVAHQEQKRRGSETISQEEMDCLLNDPKPSLFDQQFEQHIANPVRSGK